MHTGYTDLFRSFVAISKKTATAVSSLQRTKKQKQQQQVILEIWRDNQTNWCSTC